LSDLERLQGDNKTIFGVLTVVSEEKTKTKAKKKRNGEDPQKTLFEDRPLLKLLTQICREEDYIAVYSTIGDQELREYCGLASVGAAENDGAVGVGGGIEGGGEIGVDESGEGTTFSPHSPEEADQAEEAESASVDWGPLPPVAPTLDSGLNDKPPSSNALQLRLEGLISMWCNYE
jgi:hypothetical protein